MIVMRHASSGAPHLLARICRSAIINAGDGMHEHPTQALLDAFTIREHKRPARRAEGRDRRRPAAQPRAALERAAADQVGAEVWVCGPPTLMPPGIERFGVRATTSVDEAVDGADVVMMLRIQHERMHGPLHPVAARVLHAVRHDAGARCAARSPTSIIMHPGPMNRGVEIASEVADGPYSVILEQVANGVAVRMAVLYLLAGRETDLSEMS